MIVVQDGCGAKIYLLGKEGFGSVSAIIDRIRSEPFKLNTRKSLRLGQSIALCTHQNGPTSGSEMCFAIGSQRLWCWRHKLSQIQYLFF